MSASTYWATHKQTRFIDLNLGAILGSGTKQQRADLSLQLDADCEALLSIINEIRSFQNACTLVSTLPAEVLVHIAAFVSESFPPIWRICGEDGRESDQDEETIIAGWTTLTHVCRRWQAIFTSAPELWPPCDNVREANIDSFSTRSSHTLEVWQVTLPLFLPALRELNLSYLCWLKMSGTLDVLSQMPSLEILVIHECSWADTAIHRPNPTSLPRLKSLSLEKLQTDRVAWNEKEDNSPLQCLLNQLRYPRDTVLKLKPRFRIDEYADENSLSLLHWVISRVMRDVELPDSALCAGLDLSDYKSFIHIKPTPTFAAISAPHDTTQAYQSAFWQTMIDMSNLRLNDVFQDPGIMQLMQDISFLSTSMATIVQRRRWHSPTDHMLFRTFCNVEILHTYLDHNCEHHVRPYLLSVFGATDNKLHLPRMKEFWLGPIAPDGTYVRRREMFSHLVDALGIRVAHPGNVLHTLRTAIPRPSPESEEGRYAAALESLLPHVVWGETTAEDSGADM
ncbi:hypothetical protein PENSPDRAFT_757303 [Peniophora sp. CONT]|nr:hypothetical protein PENSPDRAFT_757303 [Peniophora sp. CONT]